MNHCELPQVIEPTSTPVHLCLEAASFASKKEGAAVVFSVRLPEPLKKQAQFICEKNLTDLGTYLRECTKALVRDYGVKIDE
jgi:hypothetical protein